MFESARGWLTRLSKNVAGNTLAIAAAALIPLTCAVGGAVDASRFYMASARMQQACDAGALAARKAMIDDNFSSEEKAQGLAFFDHNYPSGTFGITGLQRDYVADNEGVVTGTASGQLPTTLMNMFGFSSVSLAVDCSAEINVSNTDIMFVLDVTGSMNCPDVNPGSCTNNNNVEASNAKIKGLRQAVLDFYDVVNESTSSSAQVRYGVVPYSSGVNVGFSIPSDYMATSGDYQTRVPVWKTAGGTTQQVSFTINSVFNRGTASDWYYWYNPNGESGVWSDSACQTRVNNSTLGTNDVYIDGSIQESTIVVESETWNGSQRTRVITARGRFSKGVPTKWYNSNYNPRCYVDLQYSRYYADFRATIVENVQNQTLEFDKWEYKQSSFNLTSLYLSASHQITLPTGNSGANQTHVWDGCIEEAKTVKTTTFDPLPEAAYDLNINLIPTNNDQSWKPTLPTAVYSRWSDGSPRTSTITTSSNDVDTTPSYNGPVPATEAYYCPKAALRLAELDRTTLENYLKNSTGFRAIGSTYHDIGMIWGSRFISPSGMFRADNESAPNGDAIARHIIFMTDGALSPSSQVYTPYGMHAWDKRVTNDDNAYDEHAARLQAVCKQARAENISVWVVAFGTELTSNLTNCATPGRAYAATNSASLASTFQQIAQKIAALRLTN